MREVHQYIADDGTIFEKEYDCVEYERDCKLAEHEAEISFYNERFEPLSLKSFNLEAAFYISLYDEQACEVIEELSKEMGLESPFNTYHELERRPGLYMYDGSLGWRNWEQEYEELMNIKVSLGLD